MDFPMREIEIRKKGKQREQTRAFGSGCVDLWMAIVLAVIMVTFVACRSPGKSTAPAETDPARLVGRWMRPDGGYILQLSQPSPKGVLKAEYFNPRAINVSRAEWKHQEGRLGIFVELRDQNYPGSTYTLIYEPADDQLRGVYFQAALRQHFEVFFERLK
jgi:hypothetical protein